MNEVDYPAVLTALYPDAEWSLNANDYATLAWYSEGDAPSQAELDALWPSVRDAAAWDRVRAERDARLAACDWTQVADAPLTDGERAAWAEYRQALRDVPQSQDDPDNIVWPEQP
ncbi:MAG TPA: tail fiber assembly protein [Acidimicrobiia bacterium]